MSYLFEITILLRLLHFKYKIGVTDRISKDVIEGFDHIDSKQMLSINFREEWEIGYDSLRTRHRPKSFQIIMLSGRWVFRFHNVYQRTKLGLILSFSWLTCDSSSDPNESFSLSFCFSDCIQTKSFFKISVLIDAHRRRAKCGIHWELLIK